MGVRENVYNGRRYSKNKINMYTITEREFGKNIGVIFGTIK